MRRVTLAFCALASLAFGPPPASARAETSPQYMILDNDFQGPAGSNIQSIIPLLNNPRVHLLGVSVVIGDDWENVESARIRRFLEISHHTDIPVYDGATMPLINSVELMRLREMEFGTIPWKGAWGGLGSIAHVPDTQPPVPALVEGNPSLKAQPTPAALFLIQQVHAHPHEVTIVEAGPMTNLALAIRLDPTFAATARQLVFMGGYIDLSMESVVGNSDNASDFNLIFDPEAAHVTLTAPWPQITSLANVTNAIALSHEAIQAIAKEKPTPVTTYLAQYYEPLPFWDEVTAAVAADPSLVTKSVDAYFDVDLARGVNYGHAHIWADAIAPKAMGLRKVKIVQAIDTQRFLAGFAASAKNAMGSH
ncbi:nucleoside hydrolase [Brytella acorum]|uniref:Nucleoside hydrolase n=1 Tax=Brytella acorum TaxID=2959299 RepID=A0AA35V6D2_9PROT|nr:nucleoside hydrolase [Brytella acorum]MDF3624048.1 nucleoside hydrolase [Brytella acorum]CAI9120577.1 nucleoside hydrolase [Brytella acorum]